MVLGFAAGAIPQLRWAGLKACSYENYAAFGLPRPTRPFSPPVHPSWTAMPTRARTPHAIGTHRCPGAGSNGTTAHTPPLDGDTPNSLPARPMAPWIIISAPTTPDPTITK